MKIEKRKEKNQNYFDFTNEKRKWKKKTNSSAELSSKLNKINKLKKNKGSKGINGMQNEKPTKLNHRSR